MILVPVVLDVSDQVSSLRVSGLGRDNVLPAHWALLVSTFNQLHDAHGVEDVATVKLSRRHHLVQAYSTVFE